MVDGGRQTRVLVVGGGPAGLTAALALARRGCSVTLVETADELGGMAGSRTIGGMRVDLGSHRLHPVAPPRVEALLVELLGDDLQVRPRNGRLRLGGRWVRFPLRPADLARSLPPRFALAAIRDTLLGPLRRRRIRFDENTTDDTFAAVVGRGLGPAMLDDFYGPYARKLWGLPADRLAGDLARRRIAASSPGRLAAKVARAARPEPIVFRYPRLGYGQVVDELARRCALDGVDVRTSTSVIAVDVSQAGRVGAELSDGSSIDVDRVLWSAPVGGLPRVVEGAEAAPSIDLEHRSMVLVYLVFDGDPITSYDAHYLPGQESIATRLSEPRNYRDGPDPVGRTVLCLEVPCDRGDAVWAATPDELGERLLGEVHAMGLTDRTPVSYEVVRLPNVYPVVRPEDVEPLRRLLAWSQSIPRVTPFGRQGLFVADNLHHVMDMGLAAADAVGDDGSWDDGLWSESLRRFAANVVED